MTKHIKQSTEAAVREIRRRTRRKFSLEEKIRIVLEGLRGEQSVSELCRREGIAANLYYRWSKDFFEAGKKQLAADTTRLTPGELEAMQEMVESDDHRHMSLRGTALHAQRIGKIFASPSTGYRLVRISAACSVCFGEPDSKALLLQRPRSRMS
jgi:transposase